MIKTPTTSAPTASGVGPQRARFFDPDRVAWFEKAGWEAYYDRRWLRVQAAVAVDRITGHYSDDVAADWG